MPVPSAPNVPIGAAERLSDKVVLQLTDAILDGVLQPGEPIRDDEVANWLGVSRTPVREAISQLARLGLIELRPNRSPQVASPSTEQMHIDLAQRFAMYGLAVKKTFKNLETEEIESLAGMISDAQNVIPEGNTKNLCNALDDIFKVFVDKYEHSSISKTLSENRLRIKYALNHVDAKYDKTSLKQLMTKLDKSLQKQDEHEALDTVTKLGYFSVNPKTT